MGSCEGRRCFAPGEFSTLHPWEGRCRALAALWVYLLKPNELRNAERSTALAAVAPALWVYSLKTKAAGEISHFFRWECTERGSRVKPLRSAPTAPKARAGISPCFRVAFACCRASLRFHARHNSHRRFQRRPTRRSTIVTARFESPMSFRHTLIPAAHN